MKFLFLLAILALGAFATEINTDVNLNAEPGTETKAKVTTTHTRTVQNHPIDKRAEMETKMSSGPGAELNTQMDNGNEQMSAQAETHDRFRRWGGYYGGMGYGGYGGMGYGRGYGMGYGMRGYGGYGGYYG
ncbi:unnamed protein product [Caenorhabditis nigoni]